MDGNRDPQVAAVAALAEPSRRRLYDHVVRQREPVSRDEAATAVDLPRATVAFHLDRLVAEGLLDVVFQRRTGRTGPGAGRPSKLYRRADCSVAVSLPERSYDLAGDLLAGALAEAATSGEAPREVLDRRAYQRGRDLGRALGTGSDVPGGREAAVRVLAENGFEPRDEDGGITLVNCPFHVLARDHTELVCGMNLWLVEGVLDGVRGAGLAARLRPTPGTCCVRLDDASTGTTEPPSLH